MRQATFTAVAVLIIIVMLLHALVPELAAEALPDAPAWTQCVAAPKRACMLDRVLRIARSNQDAFVRSQTLTAIAKTQAKLGLNEDSDRALKEAVVTAHAIIFTDKRSDALNSIARAWIDRGQLANARQIADSIESPDERAYAFIRLAEAYIAAELFQEAQAVLNQARAPANAITMKARRDHCLNSIELHAPRAAALAAQKAGNITEAVRIAAGEHWYPGTIWDIIRREVEKGRSAEAMQLARNLRGKAGAAARESLIRAQLDLRLNATAEPDRGVKITIDFTQLLDIAQSIDDAGNRSYTFQDIARAQAKAGLTADARASFERALEAAQSIDDAEFRSQAFWSIAIGQAEAGLTADAGAGFERAFKAARSAPDAERQARAIEWAVLKAAEVYTNPRLQQEADIVLDQALKSVRSINADKNADDDRAKALSSIASALAQAGLPEKARAIFDEALTVALSFDPDPINPDQPDRPSLLNSVMAVDGIASDRALQAIRLGDYLNCGDESFSAMPVLKSYRQEELPKKAFCALALTYVSEAESLTKAHAFKEAEASLGRALEIANATDDLLRDATLYSVVGGYAALARAEASAGFVHEARAALDRALLASRSISDIRRAHHALDDIAQAAAFAGSTDIAVRAFEEALLAAKDIDRSYYYVFQITKLQVRNGIGPRAFSMCYKMLPTRDDDYYDTLFLLEIIGDLPS